MPARRGGSCRTGIRGRCTRASRPSIRSDDRRVYMLNSVLVLRQRRRVVHVATPHDARRRSVRLGESEGLAPCDQARRRRHRHLLRPRVEVPLRAVAAGVAVLPRAPWTTRVRTTSTAGCRTTAAGWGRARAGRPAASSTSTGRGSAAATASSPFPIRRTRASCFRAASSSDCSATTRARGRRRIIRPGDPQGAIAGRRNWNTWGKGVPDQVLGNAMHPANWDAPIALSPHDPRDHLCRREAPVPLARPRHHLGRPRRHDDWRRSDRRCR